MSSSLLADRSATHTDVSAPSAPSRTASTDGARVAAASWVLTLSGLGFTAAALAAPDALAQFYTWVASAGTETRMDAAARLGAALFGALTFGWGVTLHRIGRGVRLTTAVTAGGLAWFVVDSAASIALGYGWNALSNAGFLALLFVVLRWGARGWA